MLDIYNHLAVFGILFVSVSVSSSIIYKDDALEDLIESFYFWIMSSIVLMAGCEILAWSIWYLSGGSV